LAGLGYDPLWSHPERQSAADLLRRWVGSEPLWDQAQAFVPERLDKLLGALRPNCEGHLVLLEQQPLTTTSIFCDASTVGLGYILRIGETVLIERASLWNRAQLKWDINRKELFAACEALIQANALKNCLTGTGLELWTDSKSTLAWLNGGDPKGHGRTRAVIERWLAFVEELIAQWKAWFKTTIIRRVEGDRNPADRLSRLPYDLGGKDLTLEHLVPCQNVALASTPVSDRVPEDAVIALPQGVPDPPLPQGMDLREYIRCSQQQSEGLKLQLAYLNDRRNTGGLGSSLLRTATKFRLIVDDILVELVFPHGDITLSPIMAPVLDVQTKEGRAIAQHYATCLHVHGGHGSLHYTTWRLTRHFAGANLKRIVKGVIQDCLECRDRIAQLAARSTARIHRHLDSLAGYFGASVSCDMYTIPQGSWIMGNHYVLVMIDHFSRFCLLIAMKNKRAESVTAGLRRWADLFGSPKQFRSDNEPVFRSIARRSAFTWYFVPRYAPFTNGICERVMAVLGSFIRTTPKWLSGLMRLQYRLNTKKLPEGYTPMELVFGRTNFTHIQIDTSSPDENESSALNEVWRRAHEERSKLTLDVLHQRAMRAVEDPVRSSEHLKPGDFVIRTYDKKRSPVVVREVRSPELVITADPLTYARRVDHVRNLKLVGGNEYGELEGGTDVDGEVEVEEELEGGTDVDT